MLRTRLLLGVLALWSVSFQQGCKDLSRSLFHLSYYPLRDMRQTVVIDPQRRDPTHEQWYTLIAPDSLAVPSAGRDRWVGMLPYDEAAKNLANPQPATEASVVHGDSLFHQFCWTCHGKTLKGDGPVAATFMPPPDLLAAPTRARADGFLYTYIRHGGAVMPPYGNAVQAHDAWDIINYVRRMQKVSPR